MLWTQRCGEGRKSEGPQSRQVQNLRIVVRKSARLYVTTHGIGHDKAALHISFDGSFVRLLDFLPIQQVCDNGGKQRDGSDRVFTFRLLDDDFCPRACVILRDVLLLQAIQRALDTKQIGTSYLDGTVPSVIIQ